MKRSAVPPFLARRDLPKAGEKSTRAFVLDRAKMNVDETKRTIEVSFSSEEPVERYWGTEILDHATKSVDLSRLKASGPLLMDHNDRDQVGVVEKVWIEDKVGRAILRFSKSARAQEVWQDVLDGIRRNVSVSYSIDDVKLEAEKDGVSTYRIRSWCPSEISLVSIPADTTVGVGRNEDPTQPKPNPTPAATNTVTMNRNQILAALRSANIQFDENAPDADLIALLTRSLQASGNAGQRAAAALDPAAPATVPAGGNTANALAAERNRVADIQKLYREHNVAEIDPDGAVLLEYMGKDLSVSRFNEWLLANRYRPKALILDPSVHNDPRLLPQNQHGEGQDPNPVRQNRGVPTHRNGVPLLGNMLVNSEAYRGLFDKHGKIIGNKRGLILELPGTMARATLTTGSLTSYERPPGVVLLEQQPLRVAQLFSQGQTTREVIRILRETAYTQAATAVAEEGSKPEATFSLAEADFPVEKVAVLGRVTDEMFADFPEVRDYVNGRLMYMQESKEEDLILNGNGSTPQITGVLATSGINTLAYGTMPTLADSMHRQLTQIRALGFFEPDAFVMNPYDWEFVSLAKDGNGQYYGGGPFMGAYGVGEYSVAGRIWGKPVVATTSIAQGTVLCGAFKLGGQVWRRDGIRLDTTNSDASDFQYNRIAIRAEGRMALSIYRPLAFSALSGVPLGPGL